MKKNTPNFNKILTSDDPMPPQFKDVVPFTGLARSLVCFKHMDKFNNFKIVTLHIVEGVVVKQELSDIYANFEAEMKLFLATQASSDNLNRNWKDGMAFQK